MKTLLATAMITLVSVCCQGQQIAQITFSDASNLSYFSMMVDQNVLVRINPEGKILEWGLEMQSMRSSTYYDPKLQPYLGRVEYYGQDADSAYRGKVKSIGTANVTYYSHYDESSKVGKIKSLGTMQFDYYSNFDNAALRGKIRFAGNAILDYYSSLEDEAIRGKLKAVGSTPIAYYSTFDDKLIKGKLKNIGAATYTWYTSYDRSELRGAMKTGAYRVNIGSITYILR